MEQILQRVKFKYGVLELELEGPLAYDQFKELQANNFGGLLSPQNRTLERTPPSSSTLPVSTGSPLAIGDTHSEATLPTLSDVAVRDVAKSEREWVVVCALYLTEREGKQDFSTSDVWNLYKEAKRENHSRQANLSSNITRCVKALWLTKLKEDTYALAPEGRRKALDIAARTSSPKRSERKGKAGEEN